MNRDLFQKIVSNKLAVTAAMGVGLYAVFMNQENMQSAKHLSSVITNPFEGKRSEYVSSSTLGLRRQTDLIGRVHDPVLGDIMRGNTADEDARLNRITGYGNRFHSVVQDRLMRSGRATATEQYVEDPRNKVFGYIDVILKGGVPLELKTASAKALGRMNQPKPEHISQANFYALATNSPYALVQYTARDNPGLTKTFTVRADPGRYIQDLETVRAVQSNYSRASSTNPYLSNFRPMTSWLGGGVNYNMPTSNLSGVSDQRARLSNLPIAQHMPQQPHYNHPNGSRAGV